MKFTSPCRCGCCSSLDSGSDFVPDVEQANLLSSRKEYVYAWYIFDTKECKKNEPCLFVQKEIVYS